ncbi:MAG: UDP-N-acetylmuramoyl-tripeptide--D-alanyl-D-alanine ligase [Caldiserica bacterium]|nr:UDP-N-acetylmuramoyl-tripeptide--D-alanyl-D-alanine ligase [Caldisericota bacterium]
MSSWMLVLLVLTSSTALALALARLVYLLHMLQLEEYDTRRFVQWILLHIDRLAANPMLDLLGFLGVAVLLLRPESGPSIVIACSLSMAVGLVGLAWERRLRTRSPVKKGLVMTPRARRLLACAATLTVAACLAAFAGQERLRLAVALLMPAMAPLVLVVSRTIMEPLEASIRDWYVRDARQTLNRFSPTVVGITGSYGKTSTKFFVAHLLESRYRVLMTPESYNTAMGICRVIRGQLGPEHEVFIVELAENEKGGFEHLLSLAPCSLSIVTSVGLQHLEEFGSEAVIRRVMKGFVNMPASGPIVILNGDDPVLAEIETVPGKRLLRASAAGSLACDLHAEGVVMGAEGLSFDIVTSHDERFGCHTTLLGRHNVENILLAVTVARELGVSWSAIQDGIATLQAPPHRLQAMAGSGGVRIIDDAFNSNPAGFAMAMEVLAAFPSRRVLVTPGLVSLGDVEDVENVRAGKRAAKAADVVILVGPKKTRSVREGLLSAGFPEASILSARSLEEVTGLMQSLLAPGDTVMFENDLPDTYNE